MHAGSMSQLATATSNVAEKQCQADQPMQQTTTSSLQDAGTQTHGEAEQTDASLQQLMLHQQQHEQQHEQATVATLPRQAEEAHQQQIQQAQASSELCDDGSAPLQAASITLQTKQALVPLSEQQVAAESVLALAQQQQTQEIHAEQQAQLLCAQQQQLRCDRALPHLEMHQYAQHGPVGHEQQPQQALQTQHAQSSQPGGQAQIPHTATVQEHLQHAQPAQCMQQLQHVQHAQLPQTAQQDAQHSQGRQGQLQPAQHHALRDYAQTDSAQTEHAPVAALKGQVIPRAGEMLNVESDLVHSPVKAPNLARSVCLHKHVQPGFSDNHTCE